MFNEKSTRRSCKSAALDDPYQLCQTPPFDVSGSLSTDSMDVDDLTPGVPTGPESPAYYSDEDREQIIDLIRALEQPPSPASSLESVQPVIQTEPLFDDSTISQYYSDDFDAIFSLN